MRVWRTPAQGRKAAERLEALPERDTESQIVSLCPDKKTVSEGRAVTNTTTESS